MQSIAALGSAVEVLAKHQSLVQVAASVRRVLPRAALSKEQHRLVLSFLQDSNVPAYAPQSGEIFGVLSQMKETFEANLAQAQKDEQDAQKAYEELKAAKEAEIKNGQEQIVAKTQLLAETDENLAQAKVDLEETQKAMGLDAEFLAMLKEKCAMTDAEMEERTKTRQLEMEAVGKALEVLSGDDAMDTFSRTFSLVQTDQSKHRREAAARVLRRTGRPQLMALALHVRLDAFEKVKKAIDDMITALLKEKQDEIKHKDFCTDEFNTNELQTQTKTQEKTDHETKIADLTMVIERLAKEIDQLKAEVSEAQVQLKRAGEDREAQNKEFQTTVTDQRETQSLMTKALDFLKDFYEKNASFVQQEPAGPPPPAGFKEYKHNAQSGGVMQLIQQIITDAKAMEQEAIRSEEDAQKAYEDFVKETNGSIEAKSTEIVEKSEARAKAEGELVQAKESKEGVMLELEQLSNYNAELHQSCDFVLKNFDLRQSSRDEEVEALRQAKAILSGAKFEEFLQQ